MLLTECMGQGVISIRHQADQLSGAARASAPELTMPAVTRVGPQLEPTPSLAAQSLLAGNRSQSRNASLYGHVNDALAQPSTMQPQFSDLGRTPAAAIEQPDMMLGGPNCQHLLFFFGPQILSQMRHC